MKRSAFAISLVLIVALIFFADVYGATRIYDLIEGEYREYRMAYILGMAGVLLVIQAISLGCFYDDGKKGK